MLASLSPSLPSTSSCQSHYHMSQAKETGRNESTEELTCKEVLVQCNRPQARGKHGIGECVAYVGMIFPAQWVLLFKIWTNTFVSLAF